MYPFISFAVWTHRLAGKLPFSWLTQHSGPPQQERPQQPIFKGILEDTGTACTEESVVFLSFSECRANVFFNWSERQVFSFGFVLSFSLQNGSLDDKVSANTFSHQSLKWEFTFYSFFLTHSCSVSLHSPVPRSHQKGIRVTDKYTGEKAPSMILKRRRKSFSCHLFLHRWREVEI